MDVSEFESPAHEEVQADLRTLFRGAIRMTLEALLEEEVRELVEGLAGGSGWWGEWTCAVAATCTRR